MRVNGILSLFSFCDVCSVVSSAAAFLGWHATLPKKAFLGGRGGGDDASHPKKRLRRRLFGRDDGIILRNFKLLQNDPDSGRIFSQPPSISFKRDKNIGIFLARSVFQTSDQIGTFKCARARCKTSPFIRNFEKISGPKRSIKITDHFTCTSANVIYCITCDLCKKLYIGETGRPLGDRFREHLRDLEKDDKNASKPVARHFNLPNHSKQHTVVCGLSLHQGSTESRKTLEQKFIFQIGTLNPHGINERFSFN